MPSEPIWPSPDGVVLINRTVVAATGEPHNLLSRALLESACDKPRNHWAYGEWDWANLACELLFGLVRNHAFAQGNKRTAFVAMVIFLRQNGLNLSLADEVAYADHMVDVLEGRSTPDSFAALIRSAI